MSTQATRTNRYSESSLSAEQIAESTARLEIARKRIEDAIERAKAGQPVKFTKSGNVVVASPTESSIERKRIQPLVDALLSTGFPEKSAKSPPVLTTVRRIARVFYAMDNEVDDLIKALTDYSESLKSEGVTSSGSSEDTKGE